MAEEPQKEKEVVVERERTSSGPGTIIAVVVGLVIVILLLIYGLPYLTGSNNSSTDVNVETPAPTTDAGQ